MEVNQENMVECEEGVDAAVGGGMEAGNETEREVVVEEMEVYPIPSRKDEPLYKVHEKQFLAFCPEEIWENILGQLNDDPDAQTNCANASPYFWELLKKDRVLFLFPKVMEVIAPKTHKRKFGMHVAMADNEYEEEENDFLTEEDTDEWRASILECRLVCSAWNMAVEHCFQSPRMAGIQELSESSMDPRSAARRMASKSWTQNFFRFESLDDIQHFLGKFQESHFSGIGALPKNPIFGRWLSIQDIQEDNYKNGITELLELFGKEVWYCSIAWRDFPTTTGDEISIELVKWLCLLPNLRFLKMDGPSAVKNISRNDFRVNPIPKLEKLEILFFRWTNGLIVNEMLRVNKHVKVLKLARGFPEEVELEVGCSLTNLTYFSSVEPISVDRVLEKCGHQWKQLNKLYLEDDSKYFTKLERNWANTLTELVLKDPFGVCENYILEKSKNFRLKLPRIRWLSLWMERFFFLDFLLPMNGSLEHLDIHMDTFEDVFVKMEQKLVKKEQSIELVGFEEKMHLSNIWNFFGKLETIKMDLKREKEFLMFSKEGKKYLCEVE